MILLFNLFFLLNIYEFKIGACVFESQKSEVLVQEL